VYFEVKLDKGRKTSKKAKAVSDADCRKIMMISQKVVEDDIPEQPSLVSVTLMMFYLIMAYIMPNQKGKILLVKLVILKKSRKEKKGAAD